MGFADVLAEARAPSCLKDLLTEALKQSDTKPPLDPSNPNSRISVSAFASMCPREEVICSRLKIPRVQEIDVGLGMIFKTGQALHEIMQSDILSTSTSFIGTWSCTDCGWVHGSYDPALPNYGLIPRPQECTNSVCPSNTSKVYRSTWQTKASFRYKEIRIEDKELRISGRMDGILRLPKYSGLGIFELKSVSQNSAWKIRHVPQAEHVIQCQLYMLLTGLKWAIILYWNKAGYNLDAFTEHLVEKDEPTCLELRSQILSIWKGIAENVLPGRICANTGCPRAKLCAVAKVCFDCSDSVVANG